MKEQKYSIVWSTQFKKDYKRSMKRHLDITLLDNIIRKLSKGETLDEANKDHALSANWSGFRECHIQPDWLLIYKIEDDVLVLSSADMKELLPAQYLICLYRPYQADLLTG